MMLMSMTGFGVESVEVPGEQGEKLVFSIEIKSLNGRFFEATCKLASGFSHIEHEVISVLKKELLRGKVYIAVRPETETSVLEKMVPLLKVAKSYVHAAEQIQEYCGISGSLSIADLIALPTVFSFARETLTPAQEQAFFQGVRSVIAKVKATRMIDGKSAYADFKKIFHASGIAMKRISEYAAHIITKKKEEIKFLHAEIEKGNQFVTVKLEEQYRLLDKLDIHEEISRFEGHLATIEKVVEDLQPEKGRRLDFILQELMREVNTISAKCAHFDISTLVLDIKVDLEKAREQAQNIV